MLTYKPSQDSTTERDVMFDDAVKLIQETGMASASLIQRRLKLGYARSARLLDELEQSGIIGEVNGAKPREILIPHKNGEGQMIIPKKEPEPVKVEFEDTLTKWKKTKYADKKSNDFEIDLGIDENKKQVDFKFEKYGNLLVIGSQFTSVVDLLNNILATSMAKYSPDELRLIIIEGVRGDLIVPNQASHLLTPMIVDPEKSVSALKWCVNEIERRMKLNNLNNQSKVLILINSLNQVLNFSPSEVEDNIYQIIVQGRKYGVYFVIGTDYINPRIAKSIIANIPAKLVFKPTDKRISRDSGIPEAIELSSPDKAILETIYEGKRKLTINKVDSRKIYREIFE